MDAAKVFATSESWLDEMQSSGMSGHDIAKVLICACVQHCLMNSDPNAAARVFTKEIERLAREILDYLKRASAN